MLLVKPPDPELIPLLTPIPLGRVEAEERLIRLPLETPPWMGPVEARVIETVGALLLVEKEYTEYVDFIVAVETPLTVSVKETEALSGRVEIGAQRHKTGEEGKLVNFINF